MENLYNVEYRGRLEVHKNDTEYTLILGVPSYMAPTYISMGTDEEDVFLEYAYSELKNRNYLRIEIYKVIKTNE
jgi:hypothetical protein